MGESQNAHFQKNRYSILFFFKKTTKFVETN